MSAIMEVETMSEFKAVVLAAGKGTRLRTEGVDLPKVMRLALGRPLLKYVLSALPTKSREDVIIVVGYKKEYILEAFPQYATVEQAQQLGTGHAVGCALPALSGWEGDVLVCNGDMPLVKPETYKALLRAHIKHGNDCTILSGKSDLPLPYGRVVRDMNGGFVRIVEDRDCTPEEARIRELNSGIYVFKAPKLSWAIGQLGHDNAQGEYYITDLPDIMLRHGDKVGVCVRDMGDELIGVNTPQQLSQVEEILRSRGA